MSDSKQSKPCKSKALCVGCRNNFYNGNNPYGVEECWSYADAKLVQRLLIPVDLRPPYSMPKQWVLECYKRDRVATVNPDAIGKDGFWR